VTAADVTATTGTVRCLCEDDMHAASLTWVRPKNQGTPPLGRPWARHPSLVHPANTCDAHIPPRSVALSDAHPLRGLMTSPPLRVARGQTVWGLLSDDSDILGRRRYLVLGSSGDRVAAALSIADHSFDRVPAHSCALSSDGPQST